MSGSLREKSRRDNFKIRIDKSRRDKININIRDKNRTEERLVTAFKEIERGGIV